MNPYFNNSYDTKERFCSYWHQIDEIMSLGPDRVLEIGIGNGFVTRCLKEKGVNVKTLDIVHSLKPDIMGTVLEIPLANKVFDVISCCEVLEHLPYADFTEALREIHRVCIKYAILSLPDISTVYRFNVELPKIRPIKKLIPHPFPRPVRHIFDGEHHWEIGKREYPPERIKRDIERTGFCIRKSYRVFEYYYHRFFKLEKVKG